jgi:TetR/AcrR family transcriptional repressor of lmrAB and yxaGH operons
MSAAREHLIAATCDLLEAQGYHATGLSQILAASGAPKGSLYYYFPKGKEALAAEAVERSARQVAERIARNLAGAPSPGPGLRALADRIAEAVEQTGFRAGGPLMTVALETATGSERLNLVCREAYERLQGAFAAWLAGYGLQPARAGELATFITASLEGGILLSRVAHSGDPLRRIGVELARALAAETAGMPPLREESQK